MRISQIQAETKLKEEQKNQAMAEALAAIAEGKLADTRADIESQKTAGELKLWGQQGSLFGQQEAESKARTLTENMSRDPKIRLLTAQATSSEWQAKADQYLPSIESAKSAIENARAIYAKALNKAQADQAIAMARIMTNDMVKSGAVLDTEIDKAKTELATLTSKSGQEVIAQNLAQATYGANVAQKYVDVAYRAIQGVSLIKDFFTGKGANGFNELFKNWSW